MAERAPLTRQRFVTHVAIAIVVLAVAVMLGIAFGSTRVPVLDVVFDADDIDPTAAQIVRAIRLPRVLLAALVGGALSLAGVAFQALLRNPLADPYVLGVAGGASLGRLLPIIVGASLPLWAGATMLACGFAGALLAIFLVRVLATRHGHVDVTSLLLSGAILNAITGAAIVFVQSLLPADRLQQAIWILMGHLPSLDRGRLLLAVGLILVAAVGIGSGARSFNALALGERTAGQLGVDVDRLRRRTLVFGSLLTATAVTFAGMIGFVGLIVPHALRRLLGPDHRLLAPAAFLYGGAFLVVTDLVARVAIAPRELPVGAITALLGGPWFLLLLRSARGRRDAF